MKLKSPFLLLFIALIVFFGCSRGTDEPENSCPTISSASFQAFATSVNINIGTSASVNSYKIEYGKSGFALGSGKSLVSSNLFFEITDLQPSTTYDFYIYSICSSTEQSVPYKLSSVTTQESKCKGDVSLEFYQYSASEITLLFDYSPGSALTYELEYGEPGFTLGTGTKMSTSKYENMMTLRNLPVNKAYDFYARAVCSEGDPSAYKKYSYTTTPTCPKPFNLKSHLVSGSCNSGSALRNFSWASYGSPDSYTISLVMDINSPPGGQTFTTSSTAIAIGNMFCDWKAFYVKSNCGSSSSEWAGPYIF